MTEIERVYHPFTIWEDYKYGMYESVCFMDAQVLIRECEMTLKCPEWLRESMQFVSHNWLYAAENNLTNTHRNRQAWLGQAACCFSHSAPEYITKLAWKNLSEIEQKRANDVADSVIQEWEEKFLSGYFKWQKRNR